MTRKKKEKRSNKEINQKIKKKREHGGEEAWKVLQLEKLKADKEARLHLGKTE